MYSYYFKVYQSADLSGKKAHSYLLCYIDSTYFNTINTRKCTKLVQQLVSNGIVTHKDKIISTKLPRTNVDYYLDNWKGFGFVLKLLKAYNKQKALKETKIKFNTREKYHREETRVLDPTTMTTSCN